MPCNCSRNTVAPCSINIIHIYCSNTVSVRTRRSSWMGRFGPGQCQGWQSLPKLNNSCNANPLPIATMWTLYKSQQLAAVVALMLAIHAGRVMSIKMMGVANPHKNWLYRETPTSGVAGEDPSPDQSPRVPVLHKLDSSLATSGYGAISWRVQVKCTHKSVISSLFDSGSCTSACLISWSWEHRKSLQGQ